MLFRTVSQRPIGGNSPQTPLSAAGICPPTNSQIDKQSIPEATNRGTNGLTTVVDVEAPVHTAIEAAQIADPGVVVGVLRRTPEESEVPNTVETTKDIAITTWESGKTT